jgi:amino acid transporter
MGQVSVREKRWSCFFLGLGALSLSLLIAFFMTSLTLELRPLPPLQWTMCTWMIAVGTLSLGLTGIVLILWSFVGFREEPEPGTSATSTDEYRVRSS